MSSLSGFESYSTRWIFNRNLARKVCKEMPNHAEYFATLHTRLTQSKADDSRRDHCEMESGSPTTSSCLSCEVPTARDVRPPQRHVRVARATSTPETRPAARTRRRIHRDSMPAWDAPSPDTAYRRRPVQRRILCGLFPIAPPTLHSPRVARRVTRALPTCRSARRADKRQTRQKPAAHQGLSVIRRNRSCCVDGAKFVQRNH